MIEPPKVNEEVSQILAEKIVINREQLMKEEIDRAIDNAPQQ